MEKPLTEQQAVQAIEDALKRAEFRQYNKSFDHMATQFANDAILIKRRGIVYEVPAEAIEKVHEHAEFANNTFNAENSNAEKAVIGTNTKTETDFSEAYQSSETLWQEVAAAFLKN